MTSRQNKTADGSHEYKEGAWYLCCLGNGYWSAYSGPQATGRDSGREFKTLTSARKWAKEQDA